MNTYREKLFHRMREVTNFWLDFCVDNLVFLTLRRFKKCVNLKNIRKNEENKRNKN
jgi:hypothetical protein